MTSEELRDEYDPSQTDEPGRALAWLSQWIDRSYPEGLSTEVVLWRRVSKVAAEAGEAIDALGGVVGENPRKGITHSIDDLVEELLDVAVAALGAVEHVTGHHADARARLDDKILRVVARAQRVIELQATEKEAQA